MIRILAQCDACKTSLPVIVGRKSTCRSVTCAQCDTTYDYSAWKLRTPRTSDGTVSLNTFYQVEFVKS